MASNHPHTHQTWTLGAASTSAHFPQGHAYATHPAASTSAPTAPFPAPGLVMSAAAPRETTLAMRIRIVQPSPAAAGCVEVFEPTATVDTAVSGIAGQTVVPLSQYMGRADSLWPVPVQLLLQQLVQLPTSIANSVRASGGDCILLGPPAAPDAALAPELPAGALMVADLASNPLFHALAQNKPALAQMLLMTLQQNVAQLPPPPPSQPVHNQALALLSTTPMLGAGEPVAAGSIGGNIEDARMARAAPRERSRSPRRTSDKKRHEDSSRSRSAREDHGGRRSRTKRSRNSGSRSRSPSDHRSQRDKSRSRSRSRSRRHDQKQRSRSPPRSRPSSSPPRRDLRSSILPGAGNVHVLEFRIRNVPASDERGAQRIASLFRIPGATMELHHDPHRLEDGIGLIVKTDQPPNTVVRRVLSRSGLVLNSRILAIEPVDPKWKHMVRETPLPEIYLALNMPPPGAIQTNALSRQLELAGASPFVDRVFAPVPGTSLFYGFLSVDQRRRPNMMLARDGEVVHGHKIRIARIDDPTAFFGRMEHALHMCREIALADPDLRHLISTH